MNSPSRLGGFKILQNATRVSALLPREGELDPSRFLQLFAEKEINLPYITCLQDETDWGINFVVENSFAGRVIRFIKEHFNGIQTRSSNCVILSIFPHKKNPEISGSLFEVFAKEGVCADALANSPSAISVVIRDDMLNLASEALFQPFSFSAYRTPTDWKLAQEGKEKLYKEVVASYQEKRPKVYGLEYQEMQEYLHIKLSRKYLDQFGRCLKEFARMGANLSFLSNAPSQDEGKESLVICLPSSEELDYLGALKRFAPDLSSADPLPAATFTLNGPHFGDRYGIASDLLRTLQNNNVDILALNCTIASIIGVVRSHHIERSIQAIQECFEVPNVITNS